jgi:hypothetical protein
MLLYNFVECSKISNANRLGQLEVWTQGNSEANLTEDGFLWDFAQQQLDYASELVHRASEAQRRVLWCLTKSLHQTLVGLGVRQLDGLDAASVEQVARVLVARRGGFVESTMACQRACNDGALIQTRFVVCGSLCHLHQLGSLIDQIERKVVSEQKVQQSTLQTK